MFLISYWLVPFTNFWESSSVSAKDHAVSVSGEFKRGSQYEQAGKYPQALKWYRRAADLGDVKAQYQLANLYHQGQGTPQDTSLALEWYQRAAQAGYAPAQEKLQQLHNQESQENKAPPEVVPTQEDKITPDSSPVTVTPDKSVDEPSDEPPLDSSQPENILARLRYLYAQGRYPELIVQGSAIPEPSPPIKQLVKKAEQVQIAWVKVSNLMGNGKFQEAYDLARRYEEPELQKLALRAKRELEITLKELEYLTAKGDYATVIARGELKSEGNPEIRKLVEQAQEKKVTRAKIADLMAAEQLAAAYQLANSLRDVPFQELAIDIAEQIHRTEAEFVYLLAQGQYQQIVTQGTTKITWSNMIKKLVDKAQRTLAQNEGKEKRLKETIATENNAVETKEKSVDKEQVALIQNKETQDKENATKTSLAKSDQPVSIAVFGDSLADGIWGGVYRLLRKDKQFTVYRETVTASGLVRYDWLNRIRKLLKQKEIHIAIILMGTNDGQALLNGKQRFSYQSEQWKQAYVERVNQLMELFQEYQVSTFWVGLPTMRRTSMVSQVALLNQLYQEKASDFKEIHFLPTEQLTADEQGKYSAYLVDRSGRKKLLRTNDGVHFTITGYDMLARYIVDNIYQNLPFLRKERHDSQAQQ